MSAYIHIYYNFISFDFKEIHSFLKYAKEIEHLLCKTNIFKYIMNFKICKKKKQKDLNFEQFNKKMSFDQNSDI